MKAYLVHSGKTGQWNAKQGYRILIADGGAVRFDFPEHWLAGIDEGRVLIVDRQPPLDRCGLMVSCRQITALMSQFPMDMLLSDVTETGNNRRITFRGPIIRIFRPPLEGAWRQMLFMDPRGREACTRVCLARGGRSLATIVFDFWPEDEVHMHLPWMTLIETLAVGDYIEDPATGRRREKRG